jgi:periplasmic protein TonB
LSRYVEPEVIMFDLISGGPRHPFHDPTPAPVIASIAGHAVVLTLVVGLPLMYATDRLPRVPTMMAFVAAPPAPPPPPPPPPALARSVGKPAAARPQTAPAAGTFVVPLEAPSEIVPEPPAAMYSGEGGVVGGLEGGVADGIVGGLVAAPPPPPPPPPAPPAPRAGAPVRIGGNISAPALVKRVEPAYPDVALMAKIGGMVILEAVVDVDGTVESVKVLRSLKLLDNAAIEAVKQWKYSPLILNGVPTPFVLTVTLNFHTV